MAEADYRRRQHDGAKGASFDSVDCDEGKQFLFVAVDRTSRFAYAELHPEATRMIAAQMLSNLNEAVPYAIHHLQHA